MAQARAYRNLNNGLWSIKQRIEGKWVVVGHCDALLLSDAKPYVSAKTRERMIRLLPKRGREVHAWIEGNLVEVCDFVSFSGREVVCTDASLGSVVVPDSMTSRITYHPFDLSHAGFHWVDSGAPVGSLFAVWFNSAKQVWGV